MASPLICFFLFFSFSTFYLFRERGKEGERRKHWCVVASHTSPAGDLACNPGVCPDWESNQRPFGSQAHAQSTELHQPGPHYQFFKRGEKSALTGVAHLDGDHPAKQKFAGSIPSQGTRLGCGFSPW